MEYLGRFVFASDVISHSGKEEKVGLFVLMWLVFLTSVNVSCISRCLVLVNLTVIVMLLREF